MTQENQSEIWQVEVGGQIYEAALGDLPDWIGEGSLQPEDKVRKGNLRWIEARKVPALIPFFNARAKGEPMPLVSSVTDAAVAAETSSSDVDHDAPKNTPGITSALQNPPVEESGSTVNRPKAAPGYCKNHASVTSAYACSGCGSELCKACPSSYGGSVRICPECGAMCKPAVEAAETARRRAESSQYAGEPFGFADLGRAFAYPFKFKSSLIFGGLMFMFFSLGQSASTIGGIFLLAASLICVMLANMLWFGVLANTVENFTQGRLDADFMPSFEDFSLWDDVVHPFFLSIGVYVSSFGPFVLVAIIGAWMIMSAAGEQAKKFNDELTRVPGTPLYAPDRTAEQSQEVQNVLDRIKQQNARAVELRRQQIEAAESGGIPVTSDTNPADDADRQADEMERMIGESRAANLESVDPVGAVAMEEQQKSAMAGILRLAAPLVVIGAIALLWGLFYFPAACAVAAYSRSFLATINPLVGLDTIKRLGGTYIKILFMGLLILIASATVGFIVELVFLPFDLPKFGNIPVRIVGSLFTFYFAVVFSCVLGYALFKASDRLKLFRSH